MLEAFPEFFAAEFLGRIYEAAVMPELWPQLLGDLGRKIGAKGGLLFNLSGSRIVGSPEALAMGEAFVAAGYMNGNRRPAGLLAARHPGFQTDLDFYTEEELRTEPMYADFLIPRGFGAGSGTAILGAGFEDLCLTIEGYANHAQARERLPVLDALRPHLARAATLSAQLRMEQVRAAMAALALISVPAAMLGAGRRLVAANPLFEASLEGEVLDRASGVQLKEHRANLELGRAWRAVEAGAGRSIALPATPSAPARVLHVLPVMGAARDIFTSTTAVLVLTSTEARPPLGADLLEALFDLTPAEARVARALGQGATVAEIAAKGGNSEQTIRVHVRSLLAKSGARRQSELVRMLAGLTLPSEG